MHHHEQRAKSWRKYTPCGCVLLLFAVVVAIPVIGWMVWSMNAARLVEDELAKLRAANEPLEPSDLDPFYAIPPGKSDATRLWVDVNQTFESASFAEAVRQLPIVGEGAEIPPVGEDWEQLEAVEAFLADHSDEMSKVHKAASLGGYARFDRDFDDGIAMLLPQVQGIRSAARMLILEARVAAHQGDADGVARSIHAIFATCRAVEEDPILISDLVQVALAGIAVSELEIAVGSVEFSDADLQMLREDVRSIDFQRSLERALMGERVIGILTFRNPGKFDVSEEMPFPMRANNEDLALYLSTLAKYVEASRQPFPEALATAEEATLNVQEVVGDSGVNKLRYVFTNLLLPALDAVFGANARGTGSTHCADTSLAIEMYRRVNGKLPQTLAELVPEFMDIVPIDPMDGDPLRYVVNDDGYMLYSVGRNQVDDGGVMGDERLDEVYSIEIGARNASSEVNK
ncbi:MAG: hypothetical protein H8E66_10570 [Planctomycetes bacterium]|nr:hypothetical protein [Planctomycetota bacterium]